MHSLQMANVASPATTFYCSTETSFSMNVNQMPMIPRGLTLEWENTFNAIRHEIQLASSSTAFVDIKPYRGLFRWRRLSSACAGTLFSDRLSRPL